MHSTPQPASTSSRPNIQVTGWLLTLLTPIILYSAIHHHSPLIINEQAVNSQVVYLVLILSATVCMWIFRLLPDYIPSLFLILGILLSGIAPPEVVLSGYGSQTFFMALSFLGLSSVIIRSGLSQRFILYALHKTSKRYSLFSSIVFISGALISPVVPTTNGRASIIAPVLNDISHHIKQNSAIHAKSASALIVGISLFSPIFLSAKSINLVIWGMLTSQDQSVFGYSFWLLAALVPAILLCIFYWIGTSLVFWGNEKANIDHDYIESSYQALPPVSSSEWSSMVALLAFVLLLVTHSFHQISIAIIAFTIFFGLLFFNYLNKSQISQNIDWSFLLYLGALVGFAETMDFLQINQYLSDNLSWLYNYKKTNLAMFILVLSGIIFVLRLMLPINTTVILLAGALIPVANTYGASPWLIGFIILMMAESFIWPYQASYYLLAETMLSTKHKTVLNDFRVLLLNFMIFFFKIAALCLSIPYWQYLGIL